MYQAPFEYARAESLTHALELLAQHGEEARPLAGGMSLIPLMKLRLAQPEWVIDIGRLPDLDYIRGEDGVLRLGALTRHAQVAESSLVRERLPLACEVAGVIGDVQVRNVGTVAGSMAEADPAGDWSTALLALNGRLLCETSKGQRWLGAQEFFVDAYTTALGPDELVTQVELPASAGGGAGAYLKLERRTGDFAVASVAVQVSLDSQGVCQEVGIGLGAVGPTSLKATQAEDRLRGQTLTPEVVEEAAEQVFQVAQPLADLRGSAEYKRAVVRALFKRALDIAVRRHNGEVVEAGHV